MAQTDNEVATEIGGSSHGPAVSSAATAVDPVCGMSVDPATTPHHADHAGRAYHFCSAGCRSKFVADPAHYLSPKPGPIAASPPETGAIYTCPMHPQIRQIGPGACPICGMALEPVEITAEAPPNIELIDMSRRFWVGLAFALPLFIIEMGGHVFGLRLPISNVANAWLQLALATPVVVWAGAPFFVRGWRSLVTRKLNMFTLIAIGTGAAYLYSLVGVFAPQLFPPAFRDAHGMIGLYFEAAAVITVLVLLGQVLELRARDRTGGAIRALLDLAPKTALRIRDGAPDEEVALDQVVAGDALRVRPGDKVPVDGVIISGASAIDEAMVTGESIPATKVADDRVIGGTLNQTGSFVMRADAVGRDTMLARIVALVADAQRSRAPIQNLADAVAGWFVPAVLLASVLAFGAWVTFGPEPGIANGFVAAVAVLIIACPCALGLATPMSIMVAVGRGAGMGVLIRSAEALQKLETIDTLVVDKTGTLTEGKPKVQAIVTFNGIAEDEALRLEAALEQGSAHPLAAAIVAAAHERKLVLPIAEEFASTIGKGVGGKIEGRAVLAGTAAWLAENNIDTTEASAAADGWRTEGRTAVFLGIDGKLAAVLGIADPVKATTADAVAQLTALGLRVVMLTGDNRATADAIARRVGITEIEAEVSPEMKSAVIHRLKAEGRKVAMAGDGVNDAPALAAADVGIAMGAGADVAIEAAGVTLVRGDLVGIVRARRLSHAAMTNIRQNLWLAFVYNAAGIPIAAGVLYPVFGILLSPVIAAGAMALSSVSVIVNALRLRTVKL